MVSRLLGALGGGASLGSAVLELRTDAGNLNSGLDDAQSRTERFGRIAGAAIASVGVAAVAATAISIRQYANAGDEIQKMAQRTGLSTEAISELKHAADLSGASINDLERIVRNMQRTVVDAAEGSSSATEQLERLGVSVDELVGKSPEQQFDRMAAALASIEDPAERTSLAFDIFGRAGTQLLPMLSGGVEGLRAMREEAHELGIVFDQEAADKAAEFNDSLTRLTERLQAFQYELAENTMPIAEGFVEVLTATLELLNSLVGLGPIRVTLEFTATFADAFMKGLRVIAAVAGGNYRELVAAVESEAHLASEGGYVDFPFSGGSAGGESAPGADVPMFPSQGRDPTQPIGPDNPRYYSSRAGIGASAAGGAGVSRALQEAERAAADAIQLQRDREEAVRKRANEVLEFTLEKEIAARQRNISAMEQEANARAGLVGRLGGSGFQWSSPQQFQDTMREIIDFNASIGLDALGNPIDLGDAG